MTASVEVPSRRFAGCAVVVTGAARGIGRAVMEAFTSEGADVVGLDIHEGALAEAVAACADRAGHAVAVLGDVAARGDVRHAVEECVSRFGRLDVMVQVAGIADFAPFLDVTDESWDAIIDINLRGSWLAVQEAGRQMIAAGHGGAIVLTSSTNAFQPEEHGLVYNTSKAGQVAVMKTAAMEFARQGIRVNAVAPGIINTRLSKFVIDDPTQSEVFLNRIPLGRFAEPAEIAAPILWLCSSDASYLSGHLMVVDGAMTSGLPQPGNAAALEADLR